LLFGKFVEVGGGVVHEEIGDRDLGVEDDIEGTGLDIVGEC